MTNIDYFCVVKEEDVIDNPAPVPVEYFYRPTAKGFVVDGEGKVACLYIQDNETQLYGVPGGGVEEGETFERAFIRECMEEIGCTVRITASLGKALQVRNRKAQNYEIEYFVAELVGKKGVPTSTQADEKEVSVGWLSPEELYEGFKNQLSRLPSETYVMKFSARTHLAAFERFLKVN